ncbi:hypothetical protein, partial [Variovorax sp. LjRoot178]|uniref:hypothetical protein n=1 Tax=Variovorax sp. LjRoot178 TaxID=3342277 RepID=UPI003F50EF38
MDDIRAFRQTQFALLRNLQASPVAAPGFAIRCGSARAYAHKCRANLPRATLIKSTAGMPHA